MNRQNKQKQNRNTKTVSQKVSHVYRRVRDPLLNDASSTTPVMTFVGTDGNGAGTAAVYLAPIGVSRPTLTVSAGALSGQNVTFTPGRLPWLYNQARNFERYRILSATAIFVANIGSTSTGNITVTSSTDIADYIFVAGTQAMSTGGKTAALATVANRECRFPLDVDTTWKKVSSVTTYVTNASVQTLTPINSINDLCFTSFQFAITGGPINVSIGNFYIEYDVEFRDPVSFAQNT